MITEISPDSLKASSPIEVTEFGIMIDVKEEHIAKAVVPIEVTEFGIVIEVKEEHAAKASNPIEVIVNVLLLYITEDGMLNFPLVDLLIAEVALPVPIATYLFIESVIVYATPFTVKVCDHVEDAKQNANKNRVNLFM
jgi:hypothetical protein